MPQTRRRSARSRETKRIGPLKKGRLSKFGYVHVNELTEAQRHAAIKKAVQKFGALSVWKMINVLYIYNKSHPKNRHIFKMDRDWIKSTFGIENRS
jgi:hypothetical protein